MKTIVLALSLMLTQSVFARQMFQCSIPDPDSSDVMVVNLETPTNGTLFLSSGMQNPENERVLVRIQFDKIEKEFHIFKVINENGQGTVSIPTSVMGKSSDSVKIDIQFSGFGFTYSCFSRIYND